GSEVNYNFDDDTNVGDNIFSDGGLFWYQTAAFKTFDIAKDIADELFQDGHNSFVIKAFPFNNEEIWYRIRVGVFKSLEEVKEYRSKSNK
ncbi:MAG: SPOR domain-containing protein, partial [Melioribacteraceae bacterium]|nr:SPOR domain-containing protein [Melioribacteraceae bacterium]